MSNGPNDTPKKDESKDDKNQAGGNGGDDATSTAKRAAPEAALLLFLLAVAAIALFYRGSLNAPEPSPTVEPTLGYTVALPGNRFPDNAAFLTAGQHIDLLVYTAGTAQLTAPAVVVAVATGTTTAVQVDMARPAAERVQALLLEEKLVLQYLPATATPTPDATGTAAAATGTAAAATSTAAAAATGTAEAVATTPTPNAP